MDSLSDEVLLLVLSHVRDAVTLLDGVPLACRRWRRLAREPAVWAGVELVVPPRASSEQLRAAARVVLHAPRLRRLDLADQYAHVDGGVGRAMLVSALRRRRRLRVHEVLVRSDDSSTSQVLREAMALAWRSRDDVTMVQLDVIQHPETLITVAGERCSLYRVLADLRRLDELVLDSCFGTLLQLYAINCW